MKRPFRTVAALAALALAAAMLQFAGSTAVNAVDSTSVPLPAPLVGTYCTATPGSDYTAFGARTLAFAKGARAATLPVTICGDTPF